MYDQQYWTKRVGKYLEENWSNQPSPFAQVAATYLPQNATILELGTGASQDGLWFAKSGSVVVATDATNAQFASIAKRVLPDWSERYDLRLLNITEPFDLEDGRFDLVYAQLVLHYFDDATMHKIMTEIKRVLKPGGVLACMMNTVDDPEYVESGSNDGTVALDGLTKRYFSVETFSLFVADFTPILFDNKGKTPKDDAVGNSGMIRFIGKKHE